MRRNLMVALATSLLLASGAGLCQQTALTTVQELKAAFIFNFAKFTEWPPTAFTNATAPLVFGVLGADPVGGELKKLLNGKMLEGRPLLPAEPRSAAEARTNCHILFISSSERRRVQEILTDLRGASVLTVSEMEQFTESGGMITLVREGTRIQFQINDEAAKDAGLKIRSKLLNLAKRAEKSPQEAR